MVWPVPMRPAVQLALADARSWQFRQLLWIAVVVVGTPTDAMLLVGWQPGPVAPHPVLAGECAVAEASA